MFITHDNSISKLGINIPDLYGKIIIGNNCFLGVGSIILYGVTIPDNCIIAAGSVVTKSIEEEGIIVGGNPAKKIGTVNEMKEKYKKWNGIENTSKKKELLLNSEQYLVKR